MARGLLSRELKPMREGDRVLFPLLQRVDVGSLTMTEGDFEPHPHRPASYTNLVKLPQELKSQLPGSFDVVGEIVIVKLPKALVPYKREVGEGLLAFVPGARAVAVDGGVRGAFRLRALEVVAGKGPLETLHRENGLTFKVDLERAYFSPRLAREHDLVAREARDGESLLDLFSGIGPFTLTILRRQPRSTALTIDSNPEATALFRENAERLRVSTRADGRTEEAESYLAKAGSFDRVVMNLPREGYMYLPLVGSHVKRHGTLHFYGLASRDELAEKGMEIARTLADGDASGDWYLKGARVVHPYSPSTSLAAFTLEKIGDN